MSCYVRHLTDWLDEAGLENTKENRKKLDKAVRFVLNMPDEGCPLVWQQVKTRKCDTDFQRPVLIRLQQAQ